jgi:metal-responsive CopG/Arc/MetJ family transcriptional regulator
MRIMVYAQPHTARRIPQELLDTIDRLARTRFVSRSDAIRTLLRKQIAEDRDRGDREEAA